MLKQLALATFATAALSAAATSTHALPLFGGDCDDFGCGLNGSSYQGVLLSGVTLKQSVSGKQGVNTVILPSGEIVNLR